MPTWTARTRAGEWLDKAFKLGDLRKMRPAALDDPDLESLWRQIGGLKG